MSSLLFNCETFGNKLPKNLVKEYHKLIRCALGVRANTPIQLLYIESGLLPIEALVEARQFKFFSRFPSTLRPTSDRNILFDSLSLRPSPYLRHYQQLVEKFNNHHDIYQYHLDKVKSTIRNFAANERYKHEIYLKINPELKPSPFLNCMHPLSTHIIRFRLGTHNLPIEKGRWE